MADFITRKFGKSKRIALIAHDNMKPELIEWCFENKHVLMLRRITAVLLAVISR